MMRITLESPALIAVRNWLAGSQPTPRAGRSGSRKASRMQFRTEQLEPRLALATGLLSTLVSVVRDDNSHSLLGQGERLEIREGEELTALVTLTRKPDGPITVQFQNPAPLEVGAPLTTLRFNKNNWNQPQPVTFRSLQDGSRDGDQHVTVKMKTAVAKHPQTVATKSLKVESFDSGVVTPLAPVTATHRGSISGGGNTGSVVGSYDAQQNRGTATFKVTMPGVKHVRNRTIKVDYSVNSDHTVNVERLEGIQAGKFHLDATYRHVGVDHGLFGTLTLTQPKLGQSATATITANAGVGIVTDGTPFSGGGFDGQGNAYSWEALGSSSTLPWNGVTFDLANPNQPNFIWANGQTIAVPQGQENVNVLNLAGAAVNGSQQNQKLTLTYTDGSTAVWTQSFSDWSSPQNYDQESIVQTQTYVNSASGVTSQRYNYVYGYSYTIPYGKALASVTLPDTANVRILDLQMSSSTAIFLEYNAFGIAAPGKNLPNSKGFNNKGQYYNSQLLGNEIAWAGATFPIGAVTGTSNNFVLAQGQVVYVPLGSYEWLYLAGAVNTGRADSHSQQFTLTFSDGSTAVWSQSMSGWFYPSNTNGGVFNGETIILMGDTVVNQVGGTPKDTNYVYGYAYQIPAGKRLVSITLPNNNNLGILGMAMV